MTDLAAGGWGGGAWGGPHASPWGFGGAAPALISAFAVRENCVRLTFSAPVRYTRTGAPRDGSRPSLYAVAPVADTVGLDGEAARAVLVGRVDQAGGGGAVLDLWLDRALTHWPARYVASAALVYGADGQPVDPSASTATLFGVRAQAPVKGELLTAIGRDLANPQTPGAAAEARAQGITLGSYVVDSTGDYAFDAGEASFVKRLLRRLFADPGAYAHLGPDYGLGLRSRSKLLADARERSALGREAAEQAKREPETADAAATVAQVAPGAFELRMRVRTRFTARELAFGVPLSPG